MRLLQSLEESEIVIVPTDKTNRFRSTNKEEYKTMVKENLKKSSREIDRVRVVEICDNAKVLVDDIVLYSSLFMLINLWVFPVETKTISLSYKVCKSLLNS